MLPPTVLLESAQGLLAQRLVPQALSAFAAARESGGDPDACDAGRWECSMLLGRYSDAWAASDRIAARESSTDRFWDGAPLTGKRVMLRCLHGFGDALQFIRYAPRIRAQAASLCVETHPELVPLLRACAGVEDAITWAPPPQPAPAWDTQIEIMELPWIFRTTPATVPATFPYLDASRLERSPATAALARHMETQRSRGRVQFGFSWRSSNWNPLRTVPLPELAPALASLENCDGYSLQQDGGPELALLPTLGFPNMPLLGFPNIAAEFAELAARVSLLDAVVTVDGVLAHLAGALGKPVLLLLPHAADWRWGLEATTPWYPRTRLFRQGTPGDWAEPIAAASNALRHLKHEAHTWGPASRS